MQRNIRANIKKAETAGWSFENWWLVNNRGEHKYLPVFERAQAGGARGWGRWMLAAVILGMVFLGCRAMASTVNLTWVGSGDPRVSGYEVYYGGVSEVYTNYTYVSAKANVLTISGLTPGVTYYFNAVSLDGSGNQSPYAGEVSFTTPASALSSVALAGNSMNLVLGAPDPGITGYEIYYGSKSGNYTNYTYVSASTTNLVIHGLVPGVTYYFNAQPLNGGGAAGGMLGEISYTTPTSALSSVAMPGNSMNLVLGATTDPNITGYEVFYGSASGNYTNYTYVPASVMSVVIQGLLPGVTYYFNAEPLNGQGVAGGMLGEISYSVPSQGSVVPTQGTALSLSPVRTGGRVSSYALTAVGQIPDSWKIEQSTDLVNWSPFYYGVGGSVNLTIPATNLGRQFFRLSKN